MKGTLRLFLTLCIAVLSMTLVQAQERTYTGTVSSIEDGSPVIGASVVIVGTTQGTVTGVDGSYSIRARAGSQLSFSYMGKETQVITLGNATVVNVVLSSDAQLIDEVVAIAYGTARKRDLTGSVTSIDPDLIANQSQSSLSKVLEGTVAGLQVASVDGQPGQDMAIRIRGLGTASQNNANPLIVVDGVAYNDSDRNVLTTVNPKDVESMVVLKDAASTAMYGARGANGVILVTTKKGRMGKPKITFEGKWGVNMAGQGADFNTIDDAKDVYEFQWKSIYNTVRYGSLTPNTSNAMNPNVSHDDATLFASQHLFNFVGVGSGTDMQTAIANTPFGGPNSLGNYLLYDVPGLVDNLTPTSSSATSTSSTMNNVFLVGRDGKLNPEATFLYQDDWADYFLQTNFHQEYNISVSGASDKVDYYISAGYMDDPGYFEGSNFERYNLRSNLNMQVTKWLKAGLNMAYTRRIYQSPANRYGRSPGGASENIFHWIRASAVLPTIWQYDAEGKRVEINGVPQVNDDRGKSYSPIGLTSSRMNSGSGSYDLEKQLKQDKDQKTSNDISMSGYLEASFLRDFTFRASMSFDQTYQMQDRFRTSETGRYRAEGGAMARVYWEYMNLSSLQTLNWSHDYGKHHVDAMLGHEYNFLRISSLQFRSAQALVPGFNTFANFIATNYGAVYGANGGNDNKEALEGYFLRANYGYDNRYLFSASVRADGSSKFRTTSDRWGVFWSVGGAWRISEEAWAKDARWLNDLKLRADYGVIGNQNGVDRYSGYQTWSYAATDFVRTGQSLASGWSVSQGNAVNSSLSWENVHTMDVGLDFRLWNRFYGVIDWYERNTKNMLWKTPLSAELGQLTIDRNAAAMRTRGIEIELGVDIIQTPDMLWSVNVNGSHYRSILTRVPAGVAGENGTWVAGVDAWGAAGVGGTDEIVYLRGEGKPYYNMYIVKYMGVDQNTGMALYSHIVTQDDVTAGTYGNAKVGDVVGTSNYTSDIIDRVEIGDSTPDFMGGFGTSFTYKNWDLSLQFAYQIGGWFMSNEYALALYAYGRYNGMTFSKDLLNNTWQPGENSTAKFPMQMLNNPNGQGRISTGNEWGTSWQYTTMDVFDASYLSVRNITLGYTFPEKWMGKVGIENARVFCTLDNMWLITSQAGIDPRMDLTGGYGVGQSTYPYMRSVMFGINVTF